MLRSLFVLGVTLILLGACGGTEDRRPDAPPKESELIGEDIQAKQRELARIEGELSENLRRQKELAGQPESAETRAEMRRLQRSQFHLEAMRDQVGAEIMLAKRRRDEAIKREAMEAEMARHQPVPNQTPTPTPVPVPPPPPEPSPMPEPTPPAPEPMPEPEPAPEQEPEPIPEPGSEPAPEPKPAPAPGEETPPPPEEAPAAEKGVSRYDPVDAAPGEKRTFDERWEDVIRRVKQELERYRARTTR